MKKLFYFLPLFCLLASCVSKKNQAIKQNILTLRDSYCKAPFKYNYDNKLPSYNSDSIIAANKELKGTFSDQSILIQAMTSTDTNGKMPPPRRDVDTDGVGKVTAFIKALPPN